MGLWREFFQLTTEGTNSTKNKRFLRQVHRLTNRQIGQKTALAAGFDLVDYFCDLVVELSALFHFYADLVEGV